jgi:TatD DNase family protein
MPRLIDTHAHLDEIKSIDLALKKASAEGIEAVIAVGQDIASNRRVFELAARHQGFIYPAIGLHPWAISELNTEQINENIAYIKDNLRQACALGEVGLDYDKRVLKNTEKDTQKDVLRKLLELAVEYDKPVSLHSRYAWKDSLQLVIDTGVKKLVFHWYTGLSSTLAELIQNGYYISATPAAEYHEEHRRAIREVPLDRLLLETDSPVHYGRETRYESQPSDVLRSLKAAAEIKHISESELAGITTANAKFVFGIPRV